MASTGGWRKLQSCKATILKSFQNRTVAHFPPKSFIIRGYCDQQRSRGRSYDELRPPDRYKTKWHLDRFFNWPLRLRKDLRPVINLKNLLKTTATNSAPLSTIAINRRPLGIKYRPITFLRNFNAVFKEFYPDGKECDPHFGLTPKALALDSEEQMIYQSEAYRQDVADRLLKLLMLRRAYWVPLKIVDQLKWDLGLPDDYMDTIVAEFPHYFRVSKFKDPMVFNSMVDGLELVCWDDDIAVSVIEKACHVGAGGLNGRPLRMEQRLPSNYVIDKKAQQWLEKWQELPYISPYQNAMHLLPDSDESDKWTVAVLHELLHLLTNKTVSSQLLLKLGSHMGMQSRFKLAMLNHPGIFYMSMANRTYTVVLKEFFRRQTRTNMTQLFLWRGKFSMFMLRLNQKRDRRKLMHRYATSQLRTDPKRRAERVEEEGGEEEEEEQVEEEDVDDEMEGLEGFERGGTHCNEKDGDLPPFDEEDQDFVDEDDEFDEEGGNEDTGDTDYEDGF